MGLNFYRLQILSLRTNEWGEEELIGYIPSDDGLQAKQWLTNYMDALPPGEEVDGTQENYDWSRRLPDGRAYVYYSRPAEEP